MAKMEITPDSMIERVARRLFERGRQEGNVDPETWEDADGEMRDFLRGHARAAIEAMREPTEAMRSHFGAGWDIEATWPAMIDAALTLPGETE